MSGTGRETSGPHGQERQRPPGPFRRRRGATQGVGSHCWAPSSPGGADLLGHNVSPASANEESSGRWRR
ncbi:hypothetical protein NDU88_001644 [Pleurodeles waltl]|uniref:Uncharacterized protein n=1 Tax=Pleurodeles waltl TaxID=8319 RepID=A0AAV7VAA6_PLEWA|nr:hypothetical protein NDU88_001644 [Pleurodeles waltl]